MWDTQSKHKTKGNQITAYIRGRKGIEDICTSYWAQHATVNISLRQCNNGHGLPLFVASNFFDQIALCSLKNEAQAPSHKSTTEHGLLIPSLLHQLPKDWNAAKNQEMANMTICCSAYKYRHDNNITSGKARISIKDDLSWFYLLERKPLQLTLEAQQARL